MKIKGLSRKESNKYIIRNSLSFYTFEGYFSLFIKFLSVKPKNIFVIYFNIPLRTYIHLSLERRKEKKRGRRKRMEGKERRVFLPPFLGVVLTILMKLTVYNNVHDTGDES